MDNLQGWRGAADGRVRGRKGGGGRVLLVDYCLLSLDLYLALTLELATRCARLASPHIR